MSNIDTHLEAFTSAVYAMESAAERYSEAVIEETREGFLRSCLEQDEEADLTDLVHEYVDSLETVIYTHRARALVVGWGEEEAREQYRSEIGVMDEPSYEGLAYLILSRECCEIAYEIEAERS